MPHRVRRPAHPHDRRQEIVEARRIHYPDRRQQSAAAQVQVREFLKSPALDKDLQLKVLEVSDELDRTVRIRQRFP